MHGATMKIIFKISLQERSTQAFLETWLLCNLNLQQPATLYVASLRDKRNDFTAGGEYRDLSRRSNTNNSKNICF